MTPFNKIIKSIRKNRQDITALDIASLTDNEIDEIDEIIKSHEHKRDPLIFVVGNVIFISIFMIGHMKPDEYVYITGKYVAEHIKVSMLSRKKCIYFYIRRLDKFQRWLVTNDE